MKSVGIIGFGNFGKFLAEQLDPHAQVMVYSYSGKPNGWKASLEEVAQADYIILAVPLDSYNQVLHDLHPIINPRSILVDVCSVKVQPIRVIRNILPSQPLAATHPLFGPQTAETLEGHTLVLCPELSDRVALTEIESLASAFQLKVIRMSAEEHDKEMAVVQGLTFFIAHILKDNKLDSQTLNTPSFKRLLHLVELEKNHTDELFYTIQSGNEFTADVRQAFINQAIQLNQRINQKQSR